MLFNSYLFILIFLPVVVFVYYFLGKNQHTHAALFWLVIASLFFYAWWNPVYLPLILLSIFVNFSIGKYLSYLYEKGGKRNIYFLIIGIIFNLSLLSYFKYANFFVDTINELFGSSFELENIILPLAISFFTFQQIAYLLDAYRGNIKKTDFLRYCLFVSFFPQLISGPIVHHAEMMPQFIKNGRLYEIKNNIIIGFSIFTIGLFKKVIIADSMASYVDPVFTQVIQQGAILTSTAWLAITAYAFQIYFDFSAYSDMAIGLGAMFGIRLPLNFDSPYKARNIFDFWNRWHMTLSRFMRNHVYIPLVRNKKINLSHPACLVISILLGGLWHGANWTFVIWGALHAGILLINHYWHLFRRYIGHDLSQSSVVGIISGIAVTFFAGMITRVFFRADSLDTALIILNSMFSLSNLDSIYIENANINQQFLLIYSLLLFIVVWFMPNTQQIFKSHHDALHPLKPRKKQKTGKTNKLQACLNINFSFSIKWAVIIGVLFSLSILNMMHTKPFIYFQF